MLVKRLASIWAFLAWLTLTKPAPEREADIPKDDDLDEDWQSHQW